MKAVLNLVKNGKSCTFRMDSIKKSYTKILFAVKIIKKMNCFSTLINIYDTLFSWTTKNTHSWLS